MALTGDVYANEDSSGEEEQTMMDNNNSSAAYTLIGGNDENIKLTSSRLKEHNDKLENNSGTERDINEKDAAVSSAGAGLLFGLSGLLLGGPILGTIAGVSAAAVASNDQGPAGDNARAAGTFAIATGSKIGDVARDVNEKHGVLDWVKNVFILGWGKVRKFDEEHHTSDSIKETMSNVSDKVVGFEREHHLLENMLEGIQSGVLFLLEKVKRATNEGRYEEVQENK